MGLYQGEDITISLRGDDITNLSNNDFVVLLDPEADDIQDVIIQGRQFVYIPEDNCYIYTIPSDITKDMLGIYTLEIKIQNNKEPYNKSIFKKKDALFIERSKVKDVEIITQI